MKSADIAAALAAAAGPARAAGASGNALHTGVVTAWDEQTGLNTVTINGAEFSNLRVLSTSNSIMIRPGDVVEIVRDQTQYFILGRIQAPGAGAALNWRSAKVTALEETSSTTYTDLDTPGPTVPDVYIGSSRRCLVITTGRIAVAGDGGYFSFAVSGASSIDAVDANSAFTFSDQRVTLANTNVTLLEAADGLNQGFNTFTMKYKFESQGGFGSVDFLVRTITVMPF